MFLTLKSLLGELLMPPASLLLLALIGLAVMRRRPKLGHALVLLSVAALWLLSTPVLAYWLYRLGETLPALDLSRPGSAGAIVILGGGGVRASAPEWGGDAMPADQLWDRIAYGAHLAQRTGLPVLITDNGVGAQAMRHGLEQAFGIHPRWIDQNAFDTYENARNSARILRSAGIERIILVTHSVHMRRARVEFEAAGLSVIPAPVALRLYASNSFREFIPDAMALQYSQMVTHELIGRAVGGTLRQLRLH